MTTTTEDLGQLQDDLRAVLVGRGKNAGDADEIVFVATQAAQAAIGRLIEVVGSAPDSHRDTAIIMAINIMERLALSGYDLGPKPDCDPGDEDRGRTARTTVSGAFGLRPSARSM